MMKRMKTLMLLATLTALLVWGGQALAGQAGMMLALVIAGLMNFGAYWWSDKIVLRMYGAQGHRDRSAGAVRPHPRPRPARRPANAEGVSDSQAAPNAFATGRSPDHAALAVTEGLMALLHREELAAVIAHELGHLRNRDTLIMTVAATIAGAVSVLANIAHLGADLWWRALV